MIIKQELRLNKETKQVTTRYYIESALEPIIGDYLYWKNKDGGDTWVRRLNKSKTRRDLMTKFKIPFFKRDKDEFEFIAALISLMHTNEKRAAKIKAKYEKEADNVRRGQEGISNKAKKRAAKYGKLEAALQEYKGDKHDYEPITTIYEKANTSLQI